MSGYGTGVAAEHQLTRDEVFDLLSSPRRRGVLTYLKRSGGTAELSAMATRIAAWERGTGVEELTANDKKRVYTSLQQTHLEKLEDAGVVEYDREQKQVRATDAAEALEVYLEVVPGKAFPWREYYLALGAVGTALAFVVWADLGMFVAVPDGLVAGVIAVSLVVSAAVHYVRDRGASVSLDDGLRES